MEKNYYYRQIAVILLFLFLVFGSDVKAQTQLILPADGGFETGTTFPLNNWTNTFSGATQNRWVCSTGATAGFTGTRCAYVSNTVGNAHTYNTTILRVSHLYRTITVPAGQSQIALSFDWIGAGELGADRMKVWCVPTTYTPGYGTAIIATGSAPTGNVQVGLSEYSLQGTWTNANITIPPAYAGTSFRLVFEWSNDANSAGVQPPSGVDNVSLISQAPPPLANDSCSGATALTVNASCVYSNYTNVGATASPEVPNPTLLCANYLGADVWFTAVVPATGTIVIDTQEGGMTDSGIAIYSGTCAGLTLIECDDNDSANGLMSSITRTGLTPGSTIYIMVWNEGTSQGTFSICVSTFASLTNNECTGAISLPVSTSCSYATYTNAAATGSAVPDPGCANYLGGDVWFSAVVPSNGILIVDLNTGVMLDSGLAFYSGTCGALTFLECDDDSSANGAMSSITRSGLTPGTTIYIRVWENSNDNNGTFGICASTLANCAQTPSAVSATTTSTTATVTWTAAFPAPASGYQYYYSTSPTPPVAPTGSVGAGVTTVNLTGLTAATTYYFWVRSYCNATDQSAWVPITFFTGYCSSTSTTSTYYIENFSTSTGFSNISNIGSGYSGGGYGNFTGSAVSQNAGAAIGFTAVYFDGVSITYGFKIWVDWNNNLIFDPTEAVYAPGTLATSHSGSFTIPVGTAVGNYRMRIRAEFGNVNPTQCGSITSGETEDYTITVVAPVSCTSNPSNLGSSITTATTATISWSPAVVTPASGYQYYLSTSGTAPGTSTTPTGSTTSAVVSVNLVGLTAGVTYYFWVRSNCGGVNQGAWIGPSSFFIPTCGIGNSTGTTTLGCPAVVAGGLGLSGADPAPIACSSSTGVTLEATYLPILATTSYTVSQITPFVPPYQFSCLKNPVSVNNDDVWSPIVTLPFNFCFYGNAYSRCLISSNGAITFDLTTYAPGGYSTWSFTNPIPSNNLFLNAIFGVYHDINPRNGGEIGYELITLNTGCRALVVSWNNVPMYSCNNKLYTGMIVLYENTNIIEVYIKEKRICGGWNGGNAVVGVQNANGTVATFPTTPTTGRNTNSPNWATTNEAWRFTPSGASISTIQWYQGLGTATPIAGATSNTLTVNPAVTTDYTAAVTYTFCDGRQLIETESATVTKNLAKTWTGSSSTAWNNPNNWSPTGVPNATHCVVIPNGTPICLITGTNFNAYAYNLTIENAAVLQVNATNIITVTDKVTVNPGVPGDHFLIKNSASLVQINNVANSGIIKMERITQPMYRFDYTYWGSPMTQASSFTLGMLSPGTQFDKFYSWTPFIGTSFGTWSQEGLSSVMDPKKGYIVRAPNSFSPVIGTETAYTANFIGTPNNGDISSPVLYGTFAGNNDQYNLLGNPYPSAISATSFLNYGPNTNIIDGTIYFWTHNSPPSTSNVDPFYNDFVSNYTDSDYASWNLIGGVGTMATSTIPTGMVPNGFIGAGQGFFTRSLGIATQPSYAVFQNWMRVPNATITGSNTQFFRHSDPSNSASTEDEDFEKHRLWLNLTNNTGAFSQILVAYAEGATLGWDRGYDGIRFNDNDNITFYSTIPDNLLVIQGRPLPFNVNDEVPLGYVSTLNGEFSIRIDHFDGLFETNNIYLEDKLLNIIHDIKQTPYVFTTGIGTFNERFVLRYTNATLSVFDAQFSMASAFIYDKKLSASANENITGIDVFEINGRFVKAYKPNTDSRTFEGDFVFAQGVYFAKIKLESGKIVTQKLINQ